MFSRVLATEVKLHRRYGLLASTIAMAVAWVFVLRGLPVDWREPALPWLLLFEVTALGFFFVPALSVTERANGMTAALRLTRLSPVTALGARLVVLMSGGVAVAIAVKAAAGTGWSTPIAVGVILTTALFSLLAMILIGTADNLGPFIVRAPAMAIPLLTPTLAHATGLYEHAVTYLSPTTGGFVLLSGQWSTAAAAWLLMWVVGAVVVASRIGFDVRPSESKRPSRQESGPTIGPLPPVGRGTAIRSFALADRRTILCDGLVGILAAGIPLIALALRWFAGPGTSWLETRHGLDVTSYLPAIATFVLALHIPVMLGALAGLLFLEDRDAGLFPAIFSTPAGLATLVNYRLAATALVTVLAVGVGTAIAGISPPAGTAGILTTALAGAAVAVLTSLLMASFARDRVQGMALLKALTVPLYAPVAWWFVDHPAGWLFALSPTAWAARASWAPTAAQSVAFTAGCLLSSGLITALLRHRLACRDVVT